MSEYFYDFASFSLIILLKIVCFILGYLIIQLGYNLINSGVKGEFKFSAELGGIKADLASVSPGLLFVVLGVFLIGYAIYIEKGIEIETKPQSIVKPNPPVPPFPAPKIIERNKKVGK